MALIAAATVSAVSPSFLLRWIPAFLRCATPCRSSLSLSHTLTEQSNAVNPTSFSMGDTFRVVRGVMCLCLPMPAYAGRTPPAPAADNAINR